VTLIHALRILAGNEPVFPGRKERFWTWEETLHCQAGIFGGGEGGLEKLKIHELNETFRENGTKGKGEIRLGRLSVHAGI